MLDVLSRSTPYLLVDTILLFLLYQDNNYKCKHGSSNRRLILTAYLVVLLFIGLRGFVMTDFISYYPYFEMIHGFDSIPDVILLKGWEPGYVVYTYICKLLFPNYFVWNFLSCLIDLALLYIVFSRYSCNHLFSLLVFFVIGGLSLEMNVLRTGKAVFIFLLSIRYIEERKPLKYFGLIIIAIFFHFSAILYLPLYFILHKKIPVYGLLAIFIGGVIILFFDLSFVSSVLSHLTIFQDGDSRGAELMNRYSGSMSAYRLSFGTVERVITYIVLSFIYTKRLHKGNSDIIFYNLYIYVFIVYFYFSASHVLVQRLQYLFIPGFWVLYPSIYKHLKNNCQYVKLLFTAFLLIKSFMIGSVPENRYENVLFGIDSFEKRHSEIDFR